MMSDPAKLQRQVQQNAEDLNFFLRDLSQWETQIKSKDVKLLSSSSLSKSDDEPSPPVRAKKSVKNVTNKSKTEEPPTPPKRIPSYDYKSWDKFDVECECKKLDEEVEKEPKDLKSNDKEDDEGEEEQDDDEWEEKKDDEREEEQEDEEKDEEAESQRCKQSAMLEKDKGNQYYRVSKYDEAIVCYTKGIQLDPMNPLLIANRALALLKKEQYAAAAEDCRLAIELDPTYVKAYQRRATARRNLKLYSLAKEDLTTVLKMEPKNKEALSEIVVIDELIKSRLKATQEILERIQGQIFPVEKPQELQSKKPLKEVEIQEIDENEPLPAIFTDNSQSPTLHDKNAASPVSPENKVPDSTEILERKFVSPAKDLATKPEPNYESLVNLEMISGKETSCLLQEHADPKNKKAIPLITDITVSEKLATTSVRNVSGFPDVPTAPKSYFQFLKDYRIVKDSPDHLYAYVKKIPCKNYPFIFKDNLEPEIVSSLVSTFHFHYMWNNDDLYEPLYYLAKTKRFSMLKLFLSSSDKKEVKELFDYMKRIKVKSEEELDTLAKAYDC